MSKRVCNKKGRVGARFGRVRIGWKRQRQIDHYRAMEKQIRMTDIDEQAREVLKNIKGAIKKLMPKKMMRRHQSR